MIRGARAPAPTLMTRTRSLLSVGLLACVPLTTLAVSAPAVATESARTVVLKNIAFSPSRMTINRGQTVTFKWRDGSTKHNLTYASGKRFKGASTRSSGSYRVRFTKSGLYRYQCTLHLGMKGSIRVR